MGTEVELSRSGHCRIGVGSTVSSVALEAGDWGALDKPEQAAREVLNSSIPTMDGTNTVVLIGALQGKG